jgi:hypothetical protein
MRMDANQLQAVKRDLRFLNSRPLALIRGYDDLGKRASFDPHPVHPVNPVKKIKGSDRMTGFTGWRLWRFASRPREALKGETWFDLWTTVHRSEPFASFAAFCEEITIRFGLPPLFYSLRRRQIA